MLENQQPNVYLRRKIFMWKVLLEDNDYEISEKGFIRRRDNQHIRKTPIGARGYCVIKLRLKGPTYYLHRLVAEHFVEKALGCFTKKLCQVFVEALSGFIFFYNKFFHSSL